MNGALTVDKPRGPTSHDVVQQVRRTLGVKAGHTGTLDPLATGALPVLIGKATRLARFFAGDDKVYEAEITLGRETETFDSEGRILRESPVPDLDLQEIEALLARFEGSQFQLPPMYSAVKVGGEPLYKAARRGEVRDREPRPIVIHSLRLLERNLDRWKLRVRCSSGTYIRSLANDLGMLAGCGAHLSGLVRVRSGVFQLTHAVSLEHLKEDWEKGFQPLEQLLPQFPRIDLDQESALRIRHGNAIPLAAPAERCRLFFQDRLIALAEDRDQTLAPILVFEPAS